MSEPEKPHEETWHMFDGEPPGLALEKDRIADFDTVERAVLAAQAPAMARLLLELHKNYEAMKSAGITPVEGHWAALVSDVLRDAGVIP